MPNGQDSTFLSRLLDYFGQLPMGEPYLRPQGRGIPLLEGTAHMMQQGAAETVQGKEQTYRALREQAPPPPKVYGSSLLDSLTRNLDEFSPNASAQIPPDVISGLAKRYLGGLKASSLAPFLAMEQPLSNVYRTALSGAQAGMEALESPQVDPETGIKLLPGLRGYQSVPKFDDEGNPVLSDYDRALWNVSNILETKEGTRPDAGFLGNILSDMAVPLPLTLGKGGAAAVKGAPKVADGTFFSRLFGSGEGPVNPGRRGWLATMGGVGAATIAGIKLGGPRVVEELSEIAAKVARGGASHSDMLMTINRQVAGMEDEFANGLYDWINSGRVQAHDYVRIADDVPSAPGGWTTWDIDLDWIDTYHTQVIDAYRRAGGSADEIQTVSRRLEELRTQIEDAGNISRRATRFESTGAEPISTEEFVERELRKRHLVGDDDLEETLKREARQAGDSPWVIRREAWDAFRKSHPDLTLSPDPPIIPYSDRPFLRQSWVDASSEKELLEWFGEDWDKGSSLVFREGGTDLPGVTSSQLRSELRGKQIGEYVARQMDELEKIKGATNLDKGTKSRLIEAIRGRMQGVNLEGQKLLPVKPKFPGEEFYKKPEELRRSRYGEIVEGLEDTDPTASATAKESSQGVVGRGRRGGEPTFTISDEKIRELQAQGLNLTEMAKQLGVHKQTVSSAIKRLGPLKKAPEPELRHTDTIDEHWDALVDYLRNMGIGE